MTTPQDASLLKEHVGALQLPSVKANTCVGSSGGLTNKELSEARLCNICRYGFKDGGSGIHPCAAMHGFISAMLLAWSVVTVLCAVKCFAEPLSVNLGVWLATKLAGGVWVRLLVLPSVGCKERTIQTHSENWLFLQLTGAWFLPWWAWSSSIGCHRRFSYGLPCHVFLACHASDNLSLSSCTGHSLKSMGDPRWSTKPTPWDHDHAIWCNLVSKTDIGPGRGDVCFASVVQLAHTVQSAVISEVMFSVHHHSLQQGVILWVYSWPFDQGKVDVWRCPTTVFPKALQCPRT